MRFSKVHGRGVSASCESVPEGALRGSGWSRIGPRGISPQQAMRQDNKNNNKTTSADSSEERLPRGLCFFNQASGWQSGF
jgi:hypothetical protein